MAAKWTDVAAFPLETFGLIHSCFVRATTFYLMKNGVGFEQ